MFDKLKKIIEAYKNLATKDDPEVERIALARAEVCAACDFNKFNVCTDCGCPLAAKIRSKVICKKGKWNGIS